MESGVHGLCGRGVACVGYVGGICDRVALPVQNLVCDCCRWVADEGSSVGVCVVLWQGCWLGGAVAWAWGLPVVGVGGLSLVYVWWGHW